MTKEERQHIENSRDQDFNLDLKSLLELTDRYTLKSRDDQFAMFNDITSRANESNWSRRKLYDLMDSLFKKLAEGESKSDELLDGIENYIDAITGNCSWESVIRLSHDPEEQVEVLSFARSEKWIYKDYHE
jgi:hypothetical protein